MIYKTVAKKIENMINGTNYSIGDCLPSENKLSKEFEVSRMTIRKALNILSSFGMVETIHGKGTFITNKYFQHESNNPQSLQKYEGSKLDKLKSEVTKFSLINAPLSIAKLLNVKEKTKLYFCTRVRYLNGQPIQIEESYLPVKFFPNLTLEHLENSKFDYIKKHTNIKIKGSKSIFKPILSNGEQQVIFNLKKSSPLMQITVLNESIDGVFFDLSFITINTEIYDVTYYFLRN
ncbi:GntR family transcriptional regulator [Vibrio rumoiensis]|uniref:GntR family transcriptional regulator n=1 Tax=Vibrio rumoiensis TaxID=76258 RepID=A0ABW7J2H1_9VIBR